METSSPPSDPANLAAEFLPEGLTISDEARPVVESNLQRLAAILAGPTSDEKVEVDPQWNEWWEGVRSSGRSVSRAEFEAQEAAVQRRERAARRAAHDTRSSEILHELRARVTHPSASRPAAAMAAVSIDARAYRAARPRGAGRPRTRAVARASSRGGDSGDDGSGSEPPGEPPGETAGPPHLLLVHLRLGRVNRALARHLRRIGA